MENLILKLCSKHNLLGEDCSDSCKPKVTTAEDVKDVEVPEWKRRAVASKVDASSAPFGMSWNKEGSVSITDTSSQSQDSHEHEADSVEEENAMETS